MKFKKMNFELYTHHNINMLEKQTWKTSVIQ